MVAFTDGNAGASRLYLYDRGAVRMVMRSGAPTEVGTINYLSSGQPAIAPDGSVAVLGRAANTSGVFVAKGGALRVAAWQGEQTGDGAVANSFDTPLFSRAGTLFSVLVNDRDQIELCRLPQAPHAAGKNPARSETLNAMPVPFFGAALIGNQRGDIAFLGRRPHSEIHDVSDGNDL